MATQNKRGYGNPYTSSDLGSGAKTTTGGSYRNPRLGIEDNTAFSRGFGATFQPKQEEPIEIEELKGIGDSFGAKGDAFLNGMDYEGNPLMAKQFKEGELTRMQTQWAKCKKANNQQCLNNIAEDLALYQQGQQNHNMYYGEFVDSEVFDNETSKGQYLIDVNKQQQKKSDGTTVSAFDYAYTAKNHPDRIRNVMMQDDQGNKKNAHIFTLDDGKEYVWNLTDTNKDFLNNNFDTRDDVMLNVQTAMMKDGATQKYTDDAQYVKVGDKLTIEGENVEITTNNISQYLNKNTGYIQNAENFSKVASRNIHSTMYSPNNRSAFNALMKRLNPKEGEPTFNTSEEIKAMKDYNINDPANIPAPIQHLMLKDQVEQEWLIANASKGYKRGSDGRAILRGTEEKPEKLEIRKVTKPIDEETGGIAFGSFFSAQSPIEGLKSDFKRAVGEGTKDYEFKGNLVDLIDKNNIDVLQKEVTKLQPGTYIGKRDTLENMYRQAAFTSGSSESVTVDGVATPLANKTYEDLTDSQRIAFEKQIKQNVKSDLSQYPQTELFMYRDGKVLPDTQLKTGAYYNEDIYNFLYQFATTKDKRDSLDAGWAGSELQRQDQRIKSAVATGNTEGLSEDEIKQVNFIKQFKK